ncbi:MAG: hypothetical protein IKJ37_11185, partial [Kiritimatiellae bacterium]|nr:hypothetical protein [Kiritimatiellia bacterium]
IQIQVRSTLAHTYHFYTFYTIYTVKNPDSPTPNSKLTFRPFGRFFASENPPISKIIHRSRAI